MFSLREKKINKYNKNTGKKEQNQTEGGKDLPQT